LAGAVGAADLPEEIGFGGGWAGALPAATTGQVAAHSPPQVDLGGLAESLSKR
jgi:hypothetical protein